MNPQRVLTVALCVFLCGQALGQEMDKELSDLATKLATLTKDNGKKKVTVLDFTDLQGGASELGKYIAEELTVNLVMVKSNFSVLDRANLRKILAEHKLTATGLVDPENAKKLGQFAGLDALILGTIIPKGQTVTLTAKIITTDTAEIVGAAKTEFKAEDTVQQLLSKPADAKADGVADEPKKKEKLVSKSFGDLRIDLHPLRILNGQQYLLTMTLTNQSPKRSVWVALSRDMSTNMRATLTDPNGEEFLTSKSGISGVECSTYFQYAQTAAFDPATEIKPGDSLEATVRFFSQTANSASPGRCNLQMEILCASDYRNRSAQGRLQNLVTKIEAE